MNLTKETLLQKEEIKEEDIQYKEKLQFYRGKFYYSLREEYPFFVEIVGIFKNTEDKFLCSIIDIKQNEKKLKDSMQIPSLSENTLSFFYKLEGVYSYNSKGLIIISKDYLVQSLDWMDKNIFYKNFFELFKDESIYTRTGRLLNCNYYLFGYKGSILIEQNSNQQNKDLFILYLNYKQKEITQVLNSRDIFQFLLDICIEENQKIIEEAIQLFEKREYFTILEFTKNHHEVVRDALAYKYIGLITNKIQRKETEEINKFFELLGLKIDGFDKNGNIKYIPLTDLTNS